MIECRVCRTIHIDNTVFCEECGNYLLPPTNRDTVLLDVVDISWIGQRTNGHRGAAPLQAETLFPIISLKIEDGQPEIELALDRVITLGRMDPALNIFPEIDLSYDDFLAQFISRRHASISWKDRMVLIEDLASANGTFLNGKRLVPFLPEILEDGDMIQLGKLIIEIKIENL